MAKIKIELYDFSTLSELIKDINRTSMNINNLALNAMFMVRRDGKQNGGFSKVTTQLREFSENLITQMSIITELTNKMLHNAAKYTVCAHYDKLIEKGLFDKRAAYLSETARLNAGSLYYMGALIDDLERFQNLMRRTSRLIVSAETMSVLTKIEAENARMEAGETNFLTRQLDNAIASMSRAIKQCTATLSYA